MKIITAKIDSTLVSSTAVHIYDFHIFIALGGLFGSNIMTNLPLKVQPYVLVVRGGNR